MITCEFCEYAFADALGRYGCPNCEGEGLDHPTQEPPTMTTIKQYGAFAVAKSSLTDKSAVYAVHFTADSGEPVVIDCISEIDAHELAQRLELRTSSIAIAYHSTPAPEPVDVTIESVYGREVIRPANDRARLLASLAGTKTITRDALEHVKALGFQVRDVTPRAAL